MFLCEQNIVYHTFILITVKQKYNDPQWLFDFAVEVILEGWNKPETIDDS